MELLGNLRIVATLQQQFCDLFLARSETYVFLLHGKHLKIVELKAIDLRRIHVALLPCRQKKQFQA